MLQLYEYHHSWFFRMVQGGRRGEVEKRRVEEEGEGYLYS